MTNNTKETYYSNGKLLLSGEYAVLDGATAFALPVNLGQNLEVENNTCENTLTWKAYIINNLWFFADFDIKTLDIIKTNDKLIADRLKKIIAAAIKLNPSFKNKINSKIRTNLDFNSDWGFGSSSTLISNIAYWAKIDPYQLFFLVYNGSGYDMAAARLSNTFLYTANKDNPIINEIKFENNFSDSIFFIHLGNKQDSNDSISLYRKNTQILTSQINEISDISKQFSVCKSLDSFQILMIEHEKIISKIIKDTSIKEKYFSDFDGSIKSLGAWGGDFIMAVSKKNNNYVKNYFSNKKLNTIFNYNQLIIK